jgi:deoxyadenosine/deoxycytidine kinase
MSTGTEQRARVVHIAFEGNLGCGLSTLLADLFPPGTRMRVGATSIHFVLLPDPAAVVDARPDENMELSIFQRANEDPRLQCSYHMLVHAVRAMQLVEVWRQCMQDGQDSDNEVTVLVSERSCETDRHVHAAQAHEQGRMSGTEWLLYNLAADAVQRVHPEIEPDATVLVRTDAGVCHLRRDARAHNPEGQVPFSRRHLQDLAVRLTLWSATLTRPTMVINGDVDRADRDPAALRMCFEPLLEALLADRG